MIKVYKRTFASAIYIVSFLALNLIVGTAQAQIDAEAFGKNRIQYKKFNWQFISTQNFNVYYYDGGKAKAIAAADYAEKELKRITTIIGYFPYAKTTLIIYSSVADLRQSNIGLNEDHYQTGGETLFLKNKIELAFEGAQTEFKKNLSLQVTRLLLNDMMYGGSLKEVLQSNYMLQLPDWFLNGAATYIAEGWNVEMDNYMRDMVTKNRNKKPDVYFSRNPQLAGQSVWNYISEKYGYTSIQNILNLTRITRDIEVGIASSLNVSYKKFVRDWQQYYVQMNTFSETQGLVSLQERNQLFRKNRRNYIFTQPTFSPDGRKLAYVENDRGSYEIKVLDVGRKNIHTIRKGGYKTPNQKLDLKTPILAWKSPNQLNIIEIKRAKPLAVTHYFNRGNNAFINNLKTAIFGGQSGVLGQFSQVLNVDYSEDGKLMVMAAVKNGQSDLFLFQGNSRQPIQLTNDLYDDRHVSFLKGQNGLLFSSNRWLDTLGTSVAKLDKVADNYDLYRLDLDLTGSAPRRIVANISNELAPITEDAENILYMSEESGIRSIYRFHLTSGQKQKVTSFVQNIKVFDYDPVNKNLAFVAADRNREFVYYFPNFTPNVASANFKTVRQTTLENRTLRPVNREPVVQPAVSPDTVAVNTPAPADKTIDTRNYQFETEQNPAPASRTKTVVVNPDVTTDATQISGPSNYDLRFSMGKVVSSIYQDNLMGFGLLAEVEMADMFEDHRIRGGAFFKTDLRSSNFFAEYTNLKKRYDLNFAFRKQTLHFEPSSNADIILRYNRQEFTPTISYPLTHNLNVRLSPKLLHTRYSSVGPLNLSEGDSVDFFTGGVAEMIFDNSVTTGVNISEGTRLKVGISAFKELENANKNFNKIYLDLRHYQKIHRQITWANRISYGHFFGNDPKRFMLGGVNSWLFKKEDEDNQPIFNNQSPADLFYQEFATPMRGFDFNARTGDKFLLLNSELRVPIVQYLFQNSSLGSGFFRNLMFTAFTDIGSAYNGASPFSRKNSYNTQIIGGGLDPSDPNYDPNNTNPFQAIVINYRNPFLVGYGVGARTTLLGLYGKVDLAWGEENYERSGPKLYLSIGYDF